MLAGKSYATCYLEAADDNFDLRSLLRHRVESLRMFHSAACGQHMHACVWRRYHCYRHRASPHVKDLVEVAAAGATALLTSPPRPGPIGVVQYSRPSYVLRGYCCCRAGHCTKKALVARQWYRMRPVRLSDLTRAMLSTYTMRVCAAPASLRRPLQPILSDCKGRRSSLTFLCCRHGCYTDGCRSPQHLRKQAWATNQN